MLSDKQKLFIFSFVALVALVAFYIFAFPLLKQSKAAGTTYPFTVPALPYANNALEPYIDALTMEIHHDRHHKKYVDELNAALKDHPELHKKAIEDLLQNLDAVP